MSFFSWITNFFQGEIVPDYPRDFFIVQFSGVALGLGVKDNRNKVIRRFYVNKFGNFIEKRYRYSEERVHALKKIHKVPGYDKTKNEEVRFPVFARIMPGEAVFKTTR